jgi:hypothetical protein
MGDRVNCTLYLGGFISSAGAEDLLEAIGQISLGKDDLTGKVAIEFEEVNHAQLDTEIEEQMVASGISWIWVWEAGGEYGEGMSCYDAKTKEHAEFNTSNGSISLTLDEIDQEGAIDTARRWQRFGNDFRMHVYESDHELLGLLRNSAITQEQLDEHIEIRTGLAEQ